MSAAETPVALVTGATSGIGRACAARLAASGFRVFGTGRNPEAATLDGFALLPMEVTSDESVAACVAAVADQTGGRIDVLLSNIGTGILGAAEESTAEEAMKLFDVNFFGHVRAANAVLPLVRARKSGKLLFMSSAGGVASVPYAAHYCATKHALEGYAAALRMELRPLGIAVSVIAPGAVSTPAGDRAWKPSQRIADYDGVRDRLAQKFIDGIRGGMAPSKVADAVLSAATAAWPAPRVRVGGQSKALSLMRGLVPGRAFEALVRAAVGSDRK